MATFQKFDPKTTVFYARVSTRGQDYKSQIEAFNQHGALKENIFADKISGAAKRLPQRDLAVRKASRPGWTLVVTKLDRFGRKVLALLNTINDLEEEGAAFATLDGIIDTRNQYLGKLILNVLAAVAEFEHSLISTRTKTGMAYRKAQGAKFGKEQSLTPAKKKQAKADLGLRDKKTKRFVYSVTEVAEKYGISPTTLNNYFPAYRTKVLKNTLRGARP